jgi:hypothetical protein
MKQRRPVMARGTQDAAMSSGCHIAARPRIGFLNSASGKDPLFLNQDCAGLVAALLVCPNPRGDVVERVDNVLRPVIADHTVRPLGGITADGHGSVD